MKYNKSQSGGGDRDPWVDYKKVDLDKLKKINEITDQLKIVAEQNKGAVDAVGNKFNEYKDKVDKLGADFRSALEYLKSILDNLPSGDIDIDILRQIDENINKLKIPENITTGAEYWNDIRTKDVAQAPQVPQAQPAP